MSPEHYHHGDLRNALLREASRVLEADGVEAVTLRSLARALGVSHAAPRHHVGSRTLLLAELAAEGYDELGDAVETAMAGVPPEGLREATGEAYLRFALAHPQRYRLMFSSRLVIGDDCPERLDRAALRAFSLMNRAVGDLESTWSPDRMGEADLGAWFALHGAVMLWIDGQLRPYLSEADFLAAVAAVVAAMPDRSRGRST